MLANSVYSGIDKLCFPHVACANVLKDYLTKLRESESSEYHARFTLSVDFMVDCGMIDPPTGHALKAVGNAVWDDVLGYEGSDADV